MNTIVIGGGAAGCFAAVFSARCGNGTLIIEPNERLGRKLSITGKGRCNITNNCDLDTLMKNIPRNPSFLYSAFSRYGTESCMEFIESLGVQLKTERGNRVFPVSDKASDIVNALEREIKRLGVGIVRERAIEITVQGGRVTGVRTDKSNVPADKVILATGGLSYPATGSTGDGYKMAKALGHTVTELSPSLVPLETVQYCGDMAGVTVKNAVLSLYGGESEKLLFREQGEFTFEEYGIGGALTRSASSRMSSDPKKNKYRVSIDFKPALDEKKLDLRLQREISEGKGKRVYDVVRTLLPEKLVKTVTMFSGVDGDKRAAEISKAERRAIGGALKGFSVDIKGFRSIKEAIITDGGVSVKEIRPSDMGSKLVEGLFFAGEIIDVSGFTGGFNLQIAYATARAGAEG